MPWSHQSESAFYVGELVSHNDFHDEPSPTNLYDGAQDGHDLYFDVHVWMPVGCVELTTKNLWFVHMAQLCYPQLFLAAREVG
jgi:hypothetical protein